MLPVKALNRQRASHRMKSYEKVIVPLSFENKN